MRHIKYIPFTKPVPTRCVVLVWRRTFTRHEAIAALRNAIYACELPGVSRLVVEVGAWSFAKHANPCGGQLEAPNEKRMTEVMRSRTLTEKSMAVGQITGFGVFAGTPRSNADATPKP